MKIARLCLAALCAVGLAGPVRAETLRVITSYPPDMMELYEKAFAQVRPDIKIEFLPGHGAEALEALRAPDQSGIDVWWAPAANAFPALAREGGLRPLGSLGDGIETSVWGMRIADPAGTYLPFEIAGYGFAVRPDYLARHRLPKPTDWSDLVKPVYAGHIVMPVPSSVGYAPAMIEILLQNQGWDKGWAAWTEIAANSSLMDGGGGAALLNELFDGSKGIALIMDFFVRPARIEGKPVSFTYPSVSFVTPAHVGITTKAPHPEQARAFVQFLLSPAGQMLLMEPAVSRLPVRKSVYAKAPAGYPRPFDAAPPAHAFDQAKASARQAVLKALFDDAITSRHAKLKDLFAAIHDAEKQGDSAKAQKARALATRIPLDETAAADPALNAAMNNLDSDEAKAIRAKWRAEVNDATARAFAVLAK
ncbi:ABC transporter substrate-binding protein [Magnetospirillum fulvum]|uniref:ABC-type Fe3+ transport system, substrate-binding protein n=1 Tax=Magnetospirillum fulvum TaxID=1082 RepID=A0A1H6I1F1_MAGFU|nr:extracellular solute-binding protein [Magnetospirillum fulvum]SEH40336.1 ABC-type Fe3+ transport system, substrate-binding protein [Magnetospirillum fulvum]